MQVQRSPLPKETHLKKGAENATNKEGANKEGAKKAAPEKEILKRDQKTAPASTPTPSTKPDQGFNQRSATLTPTTKPLIAPASGVSASATTTTTAASTANQASSVNKVSDGGGAGKETGGEGKSSEKQRTSSIGDTWEQHKVGVTFDLCVIFDLSP